MSYGLRESIKRIAKGSYGQEEELPEGMDRPIDCSSGINPYGCSQTVKELIRDFHWEHFHYYPGSSAGIKASIAEYWQEVADIDSRHIHLASGSIGAIYTINKMFLSEQSTVYGYSPQFVDYINDVKSLGSDYECYLLDPEENFAFNMERFIEGMDRSRDLFYIDNPNNPTGQILDLHTLEEILKRAKALNRPVIIDEAYGDFMDLDRSAISLIHDYDNLFVIRTFSKGFGLAGIRAGYLVTSPRLGRYYSVVSNPYEMNAIARMVVMAVLKDHGFIKDSRERVRRDKEKLLRELGDFSLLETDGGVPIMTIGHPDPQVDLRALLLKYGILSVSGAEFIGLGRNYARIRLPGDIQPLLEKFKLIHRDESFGSF